MITTGQYNWVALFLLGGACMLGLAFALAALWRPARPSFLKRMTYESGAKPLGDAMVRFNIRFYLLAIVFLMFDVDVMFIFPWATAFRLLVFGESNVLYTPIGLPALEEMFLFLGILLIGWAYAFRKGALEWV
ncbi:NADH-quinone oxidoreductase subunit A [bacterium]|nr:NADH-quinone oxidoreductase subunit A [bacterium]